MCAAFDLTVLEANTEIMCLRAKGMSESTAIYSVETAGQVYKTTRTNLYTSGGTSTTMPTCPSRSTGAYVTHGVKKGRRGACEQKAATVLPNRTAAA